MGSFENYPISELHLGVNWRGFTGSVTMREGQAQDCLDCIPRDDGAFSKTFGWDRINASALSGRPVGTLGFTYRGKNNTVAGDTARPGNFGLADDGADFTKRSDRFSGHIVLTTSTFYFWNAATEAFATVSLPGGVSVLSSPKPTMLAWDDSIYIVGWTDFNLRYDPTDRVLYRWGWESAPNAPTGPLAAGGTLLADRTYKYAYTWFDLYTGEETTLGAPLEVTPTGANLTVDLTVAAYAGSRHFNDLAVGTDSDVGVAIYRTNADDDTYYFLTTLNPGTTTYSDTGDSVDTSLRPFRGTMRDEPAFTALKEFRGRFYALSDTNSQVADDVLAASANRLYYSSFTTAPFVERWEVRGYVDLPVPEGDQLTAIGGTDSTLLVWTRRGLFRCSVIEGTRTPQIIRNRMPWDVGCVGPRARTTVRGWEYFMSDRGPYRWREGMAEPQWIGENLSPQFLDPVSGMCRFSEADRLMTEVGFEWLSNTVRFAYSVDDAGRPNTHMAYWIDADAKTGDYRQGWWPQSPQIQTMDLSSAIGPLTGGLPPTGNTRQERLVFGDQNGYMYEYELTHRRAGLNATAVVRGEAATGSTTSVLETDGGLYTTGDGLTGLHVEVQSATDGTTQRREIASNTATAITVTEIFDTAPAEDDLWFVAGIPGYWRSWVDHFGDPQATKTLLRLFVGMRPTDFTVETIYPWTLDVNVGGGDFPRSFKRTRTASLSRYREKLLIGLTARFFVYEVSNSRPDELFMVTSLQRDAQGLVEKRAL